jgi:hypothetical protein
MHDKPSASPKRAQASSTVLTVKHLAREFDKDPKLIRSALRKRYNGPLHAWGNGWQWHTETDKRAVRQLLDAFPFRGRRS